MINLIINSWFLDVDRLFKIESMVLKPLDLCLKMKSPDNLKLEELTALKEKTFFSYLLELKLKKNVASTIKVKNGVNFCLPVSCFKC